MNQSIKNYLGIALIILALIGAFGVIYYTSAYARSLTYASPAFSVSGDGKVTAVPDVAQFTFSVINEGGTNLADTQSKNTESTNKAIEFLKANGIESKDIRTVGYNTYPRYTSYSCSRPYYKPVIGEDYGWDAGLTECPPSQITGYTVEQTIEVKVRDLGKVGDILSGVLENGANSTSQLGFTVDDRTQYENEARAMAMEKAREKAEVVAEAGGFEVGDLLSVDEYFSGPYPYYYKDGMGGGEEMAQSFPVIEPGSQDIAITVNLRYEIK